MSLLRIPLTLTLALGMHIGFTPPNPAAEGHKEHANFSTSGKSDIIEPLALIGAWLQKMLFWVITGFEVAVILAHHAPESAAKFHVLSLLASRGSPANIRITPAFFGGCLAAVCGTWIRLKCYKALGRFFTYHLTIQNNHRLVKSGPYGWVRHPSYLGLAFLYASPSFCFGEGSWMTECGIWNTRAGTALGIAWKIWLVYVGVGVILRTQNEDLVLKKEFGKEWENWAREVRYRVIPGVF